MRWLLIFACLSATSRTSDAELELKWSQSYHLKAVLTVPTANLTEPYEVWLDGVNGRARVDFYGGVTKVFRSYDNSQKKYRYYKIQPQSSEEYMNREVCHELSPDSSETHAINTYLPVKDFKYARDDIVNNLHTQKYVYQYTIPLEPPDVAKVVFSVWVIERERLQRNVPVPVRYVYELIERGKIVDYYQHDYVYYDVLRPKPSVLSPPPELHCGEIETNPPYKPVDPLVEYIEPAIEHARVKKAFIWFKTMHGKSYPSRREYIRRMHTYKANLRYINSFNRQGRSFRLAVNHLADLSDEELKVFLGTSFSEREMSNYYLREGDTIDDEEDDSDPDGYDHLDWREMNAVTPVKDQTSLCGSCYAFTTSAALESEWYIANGCSSESVREISEQAFIDCTWGVTTTDEGNLGCDGGTYEYTLEWIQKHGAAFTDEYGPYKAMEGRCNVQNMTKFVRIKSYTELPRKRREIKRALEFHGPLLASIDANIKTLTFYAGGIYDDAQCRTEPEWRSHGVTIVGYGKEKGQEYWLIKNSFGPNWGENGYIRMSTKNNICGVKNFVYKVDFEVNKSSMCYLKLKTNEANKKNENNDLTPME